MRLACRWVLAVEAGLAMRVEEQAARAGMPLRAYVEFLLARAAADPGPLVPAPAGLTKQPGVLPEGGCGDPTCRDCYWAPAPPRIDRSRKPAP